MVVANDVTKAGAGFGSNTNIVTFVLSDGEVIKHDIMTKRQVADKILNQLLGMFDK